MPLAWAVGGAAVASLIGSSMQANAAQSAAQQQYNAATNAQNLQQQMFNTQNAQQAPYRQTGYTALNQLLAGTQGSVPTFDQNGNITGYTIGNEQFTHQFNAADLASNLAPNYQFMLNQGLGATGENANVGGGGSNVDLARTKFAEDYAQNAYQQAFSNYQTQQGNIFNRLASLAGIGQSAQNTVSGLASTTAGNIGQAGIGAATALGSGQVGAANAYSSGLSGLGNAGTLYGLMNQNTNLGSNSLSSVANPTDNWGSSSDFSMTGA
jgi:hypothetical protein